MNQPTLYLFLLISLKVVAQDNEFLLHGIIKSDSLPIENIHIVNNRTKNGAISNAKGKFEIFAKLSDTLTISGIQFYLLTIQITEDIITSKKIEIELLQKINTLNEIELKTHDLLGNLSIDAKNNVDTLQKANSEALDISNIDFRIPLWVKVQKKNPSGLPDTTDPMIPTGGNIIGLALFIFDPIVKRISTNIKKKIDLKQKKKEYQESLIKAPDNIREKFGDQFFVKNLNISIEQIDVFINYCKPKGVIKAYMKNNEIELIDIFIRESKSFNQMNSIQKSK